MDLSKPVAIPGSTLRGTAVSDHCLSEALQSDRTLGPLLLRYPFDADAFCGNSDAARNLRAQLEAGELQDMDYVVSAVRPAAI